MSSRHSPLRSILRRAGLPAVAIIAMSFFGYYAVAGPNGMLRHHEVREALAQRQAKLAEIRQQEARLRNRVALLRQPGGVDRDLAEELIRNQLNGVRPDEVVVPLSKAAPHAH